MAAYFIVNIPVTDPRGVEEYRQMLPPIIEKYGGKFLGRGGDFEVPKGGWNPARVVALEFPFMEKAREFNHSEDYKPLFELRTASTNSEMVLVNGGV